MAAISSTTSGFWDQTSTWAGGVVPGEGDTVTIVAGHTVTLRDNRTVGNDTATVLTINGKLSWSRSASATLTLKGGIANATTGEWDMGTAASPIPAGVEAGCIINYSATMANNKYDLIFCPTNRMQTISMRGVQKTRATRTTTAITGGATTTFTVTDATGWAIGDYIVISADVENTTSQTNPIQITGVSGNDITVGSAIANSRVIGATVINIWSNVWFQNYNGSTRAAVRFQQRSGGTGVLHDIGDVSFHSIAGVNSYAGVDVYGGYFTGDSSRWTNGGPYRCAASSLLRNGTTTSTTHANLSMGSSQTSTATFTDCVVFTHSSRVASYGFLSSNAGANCAFTRCVAIGIASAYASFWSQGGMGCIVTDCVALNCNRFLRPGPAIGWQVIGGRCDYCDEVCQVNSGDATITGLEIGNNITQAEICSSVQQLGVLNLNINDCIIPASKAIAGSTLVSTPTNSLTNIVVKNRNNDNTQQEKWKYSGAIIRDNSTTKNGLSSIRFEPKVANTIHGENYEIPGGANGVTATVRGALRFDSTYGTGTPPSVTLSGLGSTPATFTAPATADTWHDFTLQVTPTSNGTLTLTVAGQSSATTGLYWLDGVVTSPWINVTRHYGCLWNNSALCTVDTDIAETDAAVVAAYAGISINHGTQTLTITENHTWQEIHDYVALDLTQTANLEVAEWFNGSLGTWTCDYNLVIDGAEVTGTGGTLTVQTGKTASMINGATLVNTQILSTTSGDTGLLSISGLTTDTAVAVYDNSGTQVEYVSGGITDYSLFLTIPNTGTWKYVMKRPGYEPTIGNFNANELTEVSPTYSLITNADGSTAYTGSSSALLNISFDGTTYAYLDIGDGYVTPQECFDECQVALSTSDGMDWLASGKTRVSQFNSAGGDFLFLSTKWRLRRASAGDVNATLNAFAVSADGTTIDGTNGSVAYLTSDSPTAIAEAVWNHLKATSVVNNTRLIPAAL